MIKELYWDFRDTIILKLDEGECYKLSLARYNIGQQALTKAINKPTVISKSEIRKGSIKIQTNSIRKKGVELSDNETELFSVVLAMGNSTDYKNYSLRFFPFNSTWLAVGEFEKTGRGSGGYHYMLPEDFLKSHFNSTTFYSEETLEKIKKLTSRKDFLNWYFEKEEIKFK